jgi:hypothetical protein
MKPLARLALMTAFACSEAALADDAIFGEGRSPLAAGDAAAVRGAAKREALHDAVLKAIKDATALDASADKFAPIVDEVAKQVRDVKIVSEDAVGSEFVTRVEVMVDRRQIKNAVRGTDLDKLNDRSFKILMLIDEYSTTTGDLHTPLEILTTYKYDAGNSFRDKSVKSSASASSDSASLAYHGKIDADSSASANLAARSGPDSASANAMASSSQHAREDLSASSAASASHASLDAKDVEAAGHTNVAYTNLVKFQDTSAPSDQHLFGDAFGGDLRDYDLSLADSSTAKSQFFGNKPITLSTLSKSADMAKFTDYARTKAGADFLMVGSATVIAGGTNAATGNFTCVVNAEMKVYATAGGEMIASAAETTQAGGMNREGCAGAAAVKVAHLMAPQFASRVLGYWADRSARGRQYTVELKGSSVSLGMRMAFAKALGSIDGATAVEPKESGPTGSKFTVTLKGRGDPMEQVYTAVSSQAAFAGKDLDGGVEGETVTLCIGKCSGPLKAAK